MFLFSPLELFCQEFLGFFVKFLLGDLSIVVSRALKSLTVIVLDSVFNLVVFYFNLVGASTFVDMC
jgi:hypothetical protein